MGEFQYGSRERQYLSSVGQGEQRRRNLSNGVGISLTSSEITTILSVCCCKGCVNYLPVSKGCCNYCALAARVGAE